jgi:pimeloyl-ACP methyl ester carboxylesterase/class 3 adenylate cyclase
MILVGISATLVWFSGGNLHMTDNKPPETLYARLDDLSIAYQVFGQGQRDLVMVPGIVSHLEQAWEDPFHAAFRRQLGEAFRVITFDKRGQGMSDRIDGVPSLDERMDDLRAVMDAAGSQRATLFGVSEGGPMSVLFAASHPEKVERLVLFGAMARFAGADDYPHRPAISLYIDDFVAAWGKNAIAPLMEPENGYEPGYPEALARMERMSATPTAVRKFLLANELIDVRPILEDVCVPTLVIHRRSDRGVSRQNGRYLADNIARAVYLELPGQSHLPWLEDSAAVADAIIHFAHADVSEPAGGDTNERRLATALFTDIAQSTSQLARLGDHQWSKLLDRHDKIANELVKANRGRIVKNTGDGLLALFDGPARAIHCALALITQLGQIGLDLRAGLHVGEVVQRGGDVTGIAINIAARVMAEAQAGEILLTRTLMDLTGGSGIAFRTHGSHELRGIPGSFELFSPFQDAT